MKKVSFETALQQLEVIVQKLETGELPLEKAIEHFEKGMQLSRYCTEKLDESEKRITILMESADGKLHEAPMDDSE